MPKGYYRTVACLLSCAAAALGSAAQTNLARTGAQQKVALVAESCPRPAAGSAVENPPALFSSNGVLRVSFSYQTRMDDHNRQLFCFMTPDGLQNPTLHVSPGEHLIVTVTNNTPAGMHPMALSGPNCGATTMDTSSVNLHYHGTNISPVCGQDEVIKTIINSGETFQYDLAFPSNEPPGLYWYHPHVHGIADPTVLGGAVGALVVDGINNVQPAVAGLPQLILVLRDQVQLQGLESPEGMCSIPFRDITVNNVPVDSLQEIPNGPVTFTPAVLKVHPHEKQFWRVTNSAADSIMDLQVVYDGKPQTLQLAAIDAVPVNSQDGTQPGSLIPITHFRLPPAARVEFIVTTPAGSVKKAQLITTQIKTGADCDPTRPIFDIAAGSDNQSIGKPQTAGKKTDDVVPAFTKLNTSSQRFAGLAAAPIAASRVVYFNEKEDPEQFFMAVEGQPEAVFDPNAPPAIIATQGTSEQWTVQNRTTESHEFHMHQIHFLVQSQNDFAVNGQPVAPAITGQYADMIEVPAWDGNPAHPYPSVSLLMDFRGPDVGDFVFHCHILEHEDGGMMNIIRVVQPTAKKHDESAPAGEKLEESTGRGNL
ncbi:MAG TPA: multicopper oxidase domain-containing protein [Candidatus Acidoferrum sp.]|nr:multicopper oxidase domain-containing protein [Candidatus Acidoferrum sp.]